MLSKIRTLLLYAVSLIGVTTIILYILGYRPIIASNTTPDWEAIGVIATIVLGILTLIITIQIAGIENRSQQKQTKLAVFELRYNIYESLDLLFAFAELIEKEKVIEKGQTENYVIWFDKNIKKHEVLLERLHKCNLLFSPELAAKITLVASASTMLFISLEELFNVSDINQQIIEDISNHCTRVLKNKESICREVESIISLEKV